MAVLYSEQWKTNRKDHRQARAEGGAEGAWAPAPLPKVPFCQGNFLFFYFFYFFLNTLLWRPAQSNY